MPKGKLIYNGKYFKVYEADGKYRIYEKEVGFHKTSYKIKETAVNRAKTLNKKANTIPWWDR